MIGLVVQVTDANALYSPMLSRKVAEIKQHYQSSQAQNGTGSILEKIEQITAYDNAKRASFDETGISGNAKIAQALVFDTTFNFLLEFPRDTLLMVFNINAVNGEFISNCLRDEIWSLELLRDKVGAEMVKAYTLLDTYHGSLLMKDYSYLTTNLDLLRRYGSNPNAKISATLYKEPVTITSSKYFFGEDATGDPPLNYYSNVGVFSSSDATGCPDGEFEEAFEAVLNSWKTIKGTVGGNSLFSAEKWGSIMEMAKANARTKAKQWISANQISLTTGGEEGGSPQSLVKGGGWDKFVGNVKTQLKILKNMVGPVMPFFSSATYNPPASTATSGQGIGTDCKFYNHEDGFYRDCSEDMIEEYELCQKNEELAEKEAKEKEIKCVRFLNANETLSISDKINRQLALEYTNKKDQEDVENAFVYSITMDSVAEENIYFMDGILWDMNGHIQRGYGAWGQEAGEGIPILTYKIGKLSSKQCQNK